MSKDSKFYANGMEYFDSFPGVYDNGYRGDNVQTKINSAPFDREQPLVQVYSSGEIDEKIEEVIKSTSNMRIVCTLIPCFSSDQLRSEYMKKYAEYLTDSNEYTDFTDSVVSYNSDTLKMINIENCKDKARAIASISSVKSRLELLCYYYSGKVRSGEKEIATILASLPDRLKLQLRDMVSIREQGIVLSELVPDEKTDELKSQWVEGNSDLDSAINVTASMKNVDDKKALAQKYGFESYGEFVASLPLEDKEAFLNGKNDVREKVLVIMALPKEQRIEYFENLPKKYREEIELGQLTNKERLDMLSDKEGSLSRDEKLAIAKSFERFRKDEQKDDIESLEDLDDELQRKLLSMIFERKARDAKKATYKYNDERIALRFSEHQHLVEKYKNLLTKSDKEQEIK